MIKCKICDREMMNEKGLSYHIRIKHQMGYYDYLTTFEGFQPKVCPECNKTIEYDKENRGSIRRYKNRKFCSVKCQMKNEEYKAGCSERAYANKNFIHSMKGKHHSAETKAKISASVTKSHLEGFKYNLGTYTSSKTGKDCLFRSSWEEMYMKMLDERENVIAWEYEPFAIPYEYEGSRNYIIDFAVWYRDGSKELIEVGYKESKEDDRSMEKFEAAKSFAEKRGFKFKLITEENELFMV